MTHLRLEPSLRDLKKIRQRAIHGLFETFEQFSEGTVIVNTDGRIVWINERYAERFGFASAADVIGRPVEEVIPHTMMRQVVHSGKPILLDIMQTHTEPLVVMRLPIKDEDGTTLGAVGFALFDELKNLSPLFAHFSRVQSELDCVRKELAQERSARYSFSHFIGDSPASLEVKTRARRAAEMDAPVLLLGETGTGKELLAHAIHGASSRAHRPLVSVNMGAIPETLLEAEFFGVAPGAYTGAEKSGRAGKLHLADGGTLFLDEIGDLPLSLQGKLLRVLQEKEFEALGSNRMQRADIRIIAATAADLPALVEGKRFRADLYYRLNVLPIAVPPLRDRPGDIRALAASLLGQITAQTSLRCSRISDAAVELLRRYDWPGNVRELRNILERAAMMADADCLEADDFAPLLPYCILPGETVQAVGYDEAMAAFEAQLLRRVLTESGGSVPAAAKALGLGRSTLYKKLAKLEPASPNRDSISK